MKMIKKLSAAFVAFAMVMMTVVPAFAAEGDKTITNNVEGHTFAAYQIFSGTIKSTDTETGKHTLENIKWGNGINSTAFLTALKESNDFGESNPFTDAKTATDVAKAMESLVADQSIKLAQIAFANKTNTSTAIPAPTKNSDGNLTPATVDVAPGFYLIVDTTTTGLGDAKNPAILLVNGDTVIKDKKEKTTVEKKVKDGEEWKDTADFAIGDEIDFKLSSKVIAEPQLSQYNTYKYVFHDTLSSGLTALPDKANTPVDVTVKVGETTVPQYIGEGESRVTQYTVTAPDTENKFTVTLDNLLTLKDADGYSISVAGQTVTVEYKAKLNSNAVIGGTGNPNTVQLEYSNDPNGNGTGKTEEDKVKVFTFQLTGTKVNIVDETDTLKGAEFVLYRTSDNLPNSTPKEYAKISEGKVTEWVSSETDINKDSVGYADYKVTSGENGIFNIAGLDEGTYFLQETVAPKGYVLKTTPFKFEIKAELNDTQQTLTGLTITMDEETTPKPGTPATGIVTGNFANSMTAELPETGGMGTTMLYVIGGVLLVGSAILLITKKRMSNEG